MLKVLQAYALFSVGVKISLSNFNNGARQTIFSTHQSSRIEENISTLFGAKFLSSLLSFDLGVDEAEVRQFLHGVGNSTQQHTAAVEDEDDILDAKGEADSEAEAELNQSTALDYSSDKVLSEFTAKVKGLVSKVGVGVGRSDNDRQFVFCNGRPVDMPKMVRALNEVWRRYEMKQKPAFIIDLKVSMGSFDVNLTPDKREVLIQHEDAIIEKMKLILDDLYSPSRSTFVAGKGQAFSSTQIDQDISTFLSPIAKTETPSSQPTLTSSSSVEATPSSQSFERPDVTEYPEHRPHPVVNTIWATEKDHTILNSFVDIDKKRIGLSPVEQSCVSAESLVNLDSMQNLLTTPSEPNAAKVTQTFIWHNQPTIHGKRCRRKGAADRQLKRLRSIEPTFRCSLYENNSVYRDEIHKKEENDDEEFDSQDAETNKKAILDENSFKLLKKSVSSCYFIVVRNI